MADNNIDRYNPAAKTTYEDVARQRKLAEEENYTPATLPETTTPLVPNYMPGEGVYAQPKFPDYASRIAAAEYEEPYIAKEISNSYSEALARNSYRGATPAPPPLNPYGPKVSIRESHQMGNDGVWRTKYPNYIPGINNEDYYARRQSGWSKFWNGVGKFALKSALYGAQGVVSLPDKLINMASEGSYKAALNTNMDKFVGDLDQQIDMLLPHYYKKEVEDYNFGQKLFKDTGNFLWNDVLGNGMSFTVGAMISAYMTGGLGVGSLGNIGAKLGGRIGAKLAARQAANRGIGSLKSVFNDYVRKGVATGRNVGEAAKTLTLLATSAGFESSVEANSFMKQSESDFKDYYRKIYGRDPNAEEMTVFRNSNADVGSAIFAANMGIVGLSNWLLFGKYIGLGGKAIPGLEKKLNKHLFGLGTEVAKPGEMAIKITNPNIGQKIAGNVFNIMKRPVSEGLWEEGSQGAVQNTAEEYVKSRYDNVAMNGAVDVLDAISEGFKKQYTSKEGWTEIGIGAIIGSLFGMREGFFGVKEYSNSQILLERQVNEYNKASSNLNTAALNTLKKSMSLGPQVRSDAQSMTGKELDDAMFEKMSIDNQMGTLEDSAENFRQMVDMMPISEIAEANGMSLEEAKKYKDSIIDNYNNRLSDFRSAQGFAEDLIGDDSKIEFRKYVARNAFLGLQSESRMKDIASVIETLSGQPRVADALSTFSRLSGRARERAMAIRGIRSRIEELESEIEDLATRPRNVEGKDPQAESIQRKTRELERLRTNYNNSLSELSTLIGKEFSIEELVGKTESVLSSPLSPISSQDVIEAYDTLVAFDDYFNVKSRQEKKFTAKDKAMRSLVNEYRRSLMDYRNMNNFLSKMLDKRFLAEENRGFSKALSSLWSTPYKGDDKVPDFAEPNKVGEYDTDEVVDQAVSEGKISEDEAWTIKAFMHALDKVREDRMKEAEDDIKESPLTESVSDEDYEAAMDNPIMVPAVRQSIIDKLYTGNADLLTAREKDVYDKYKQDFDDYVSSLGDSPVNLIKSLSEKADRLTSPRSVYEDNKAIIDMAKSNLEPDQRKELDDAISSYVDIMNRRDKGEKVDEDKLADSVFTIEDLGQVGNITDLLPYIEQNRIIDKGRISESTLSNFGEDDANIDSLVNELDESDNTPGANIDSVQNPETLMVRRISNDGNERYEIAGLRADKFISSIKSLVPIQISSETNANGTKRYFLNIGGETATVIELPYHARWSIDKESARVLNRYTDVSIQDVGNSYSLVYKRLDSDELVPYRTGVGFGENEVDKIDQEALSSLKKGDKVNLEIDVNDTYNQSLFAEYNDAVQSGDKKRIESAENKLVSNMVIKVMSGNRFVSVVKADTGGIDGISKIRRTAFNKWKKDAGRSATISVGTHVVAQTLPGRPVFNMRVNGQGYGQVENLSITEKGAEKVSDVGYVLNGKVVLKNGSKYTGFPFAYSILNDKGNNYKNVRVPVVVIKGKNGLNYLFPVSLRSVESEEGQKWMSFIDMLLESGDSELLQMGQDDIQDLNAYLTKLGLDPASYQVSYLNPISGLIKAREAIEKLSTVPDVVKWVEDGSRSVKDIVMSEVESGIDFEGEMFVAPKIRIQFGKSSSRPKSLIEDDLPFSDEGKTVTSKEDVEVYEEEMPEEEAVRETQPAPPAQPAPAAQATQSLPGKKRTSRKNFSLMLNEIESHIEKEGLPPYANIFDFIARKIVGGDLRFLRERGNPKSLKEEMGLEPKGTVGDKISTPSGKGGKTLEEYVSWLRSQTDQVVEDYVGPRSDEQIISELKNFLKYINFVPSKALNYSLRVNGMDILKEYGTKEEVEKMESDINSLVSKVLPTVDNKTVEDVSTAIKSNNLPAIWEPVESLDMTNEEKIEFLNNVADFLSGIPEYDAVVESIESESDNILNNGKEGSAEGGAVRAEEDGDKKGDGEGKGQSRTNVEVKGNVELPGYEEGRVDNYRKNGDKFSDIAEVTLWLLRRAAGITSIPEGEEVYVEGDEVNSIMIDMESRYGIDTINHSHTTKAIRDLNGVSGYKVEYGLTFLTYDPFIRISNLRKGSKAAKDEPRISEESLTHISRVTTPYFLYGGDEAYTSVPAKVEPIPEKIMGRNGIKFGMSVVELTKLGYKKAGGNWIYKFYMNSGVYDLYNISTGEAFRAKPDLGVKISSSAFIRSLSQSGRKIQNMISNMSQEEIDRNKNLVEGSDNSDSINELNKEC